MPAPRIITVNLHPAIDRIIEAPGLAAGAHVRGRVVGRQAAGKGINVARALARLGRGSLAMGFVGRGEAGWFARSTRAAGRSGGGRIRCAFTPVAGPTRENLTLVDSTVNGGRETHIRLSGLSVRAEDFARLRQALAGRVRAGDVVILAGSLPPGMKAGDVVHLIASVQRAGARVAVDIDPGALAAVLRAGQRLWVIKPNEEEARAALGRRFAWAPAGRLAAVLGGHAEWAAVSMGSRGAILVHGQEQWTGRIPRTALFRPVRSTVGCGDCFLAGMVDAILGGGAAEDVLGRALAVGAANAMVLGAGNFHMGDVRSVRGEVRVSALRASKG